MVETFPYPTWRYHPSEGAKLFNEGTPVPAGWFDHPDKARASNSVAENVTTDADAFDGMTDAELRDFITKRDGDSPHHKTGRAKLLLLARKTSQTI